MDIKGLDHKFIKDALKVTSFNIPTSEFTKITHKKEIQFLYIQNVFPGINFSDFVSGGINKSNLNSAIDKLRANDSKAVEEIHSYTPSGIGPGEVLLYIVSNNLVLGGGSSAGVDAVVNGVGYEIKAAKLSTDGFFSDFKLGGTVNIRPFQDQIFQLADLAGISYKSTKTEFSSSLMAELKRKQPQQYASIERGYRQAASSYFGSKSVIFINNSGRKKGTIEKMGPIREQDIFMERVTSNTLKPKIKK